LLDPLGFGCAAEPGSGEDIVPVRYRDGRPLLFGRNIELLNSPQSDSEVAGIAVQVDVGDGCQPGA
jgi:hypothetical protein